MKGDGSTAEQTIVVQPRSRATLRPCDVMGHSDDVGRDFSTMIETLDGTKVVVERPMYFNYKNAWLGGHCESGRVELAPSFYFAEGSVRPGFDSFICIANPSKDPSDVKVTFMRGDGTTKEAVREMPPFSRKTINVSDVIGRGDGAPHDFSCRVDSVNGTKISAERVMYFDYGGPGTRPGAGWSGGHCEMGLSKPSTKLYFAEGTVRPGFVPYICIQNPDDRTAQVTVTYMKGDGSMMRQSLSVGPHTRETINVSQVWNTLQVSGSGDGGHALLDQYNGLEALFTKLLYDQVMAVNMSVDVMNYVDPTRGRATTFLSRCASNFQNEMLSFLDNAERLVMSKATMSEQTGKPVFVFPEQGQNIINRANFIVNSMYQQAIAKYQDPNATYDNPQPVIMGTVLTTADVNSVGTLYGVTARDTTTGQTYPADSTYAVPSQPYICNATVWQTMNTTGELVPSFYDTWSADKSTVNYSSAMSVTRYTFTGSKVVNGHTYDILDKNGNKLVSVVVNTYDDDFNQVAGGPNVFGSFSAIVSNNGGDIFMDKSGWTVVKNDRYTKYSTHGSVTNTYDINTLSPKKAQTSGSDSYDATADLHGYMTIGRTFKAAQSAQRAKVSCTGHFNGSLGVKQLMDGGDLEASFTIQVTDQTDNNKVYSIKTQQVKIDKDSKSTSASYSVDVSADTGIMPLSVNHTYQLTVETHINQNPNGYYWGPTTLSSSGSVTNCYVTILQ